MAFTLIVEDLGSGKIRNHPRFEDSRRKFDLRKRQTVSHDLNVSQTEFRRKLVS